MNKPFLLKAVGKDYLWGGNRLNDDFSKNIDIQPLAESWECSTHPSGLSLVNSGRYTGEILRDVLKNNPEFLGKHPRETMKANGLEEFNLPILIKLIDAKSNLSIQVHPNDNYAKEHENGQLGKTEMWYVLDATKDAQLIYGLRQDMTKEEVQTALTQGTFEECLNRVHIQKNDVFMIPAGTIHAICAGALVAEIQENSDLTYRLYDYDRIDKNGKKRKLHIEKALDVSNLNVVGKPSQPMRVLNFRPGIAQELLCRCKYFQVERLLLNTERIRKLSSVHADSMSFVVLLCVGGCGMFEFDDEKLPFFKGDCLFIPADSVEVRLHGKAEFLKVNC